MTPDFSEFKKFPPDNFDIITANSVLVLRNKRTKKLHHIMRYGDTWVLSEMYYSKGAAVNIISYYRTSDLYRLLRLVGYDPKHDYHAWKRGDFDALVQRLQNS